MSWAATMNELANTWKVGAGILALILLRFALASTNAALAGLRTPLMSVLATIWGPRAQRRRKPEDTEEAAPPTPAEEMRRSSIEFVDSALIALVLVFMVLRPFVIQAFYIPSGSMQPTLEINDKILVNKFLYRFRPVERGDVIVFKAPPDADLEEKDFIKRVVAVGGDTVEFRDDQRVYVNGKALAVDGGPEGLMEEVYAPGTAAHAKRHLIAEPPYYSEPPRTVRPGHVFVMGDNRNNSKDSRSWGDLELGRVRGKAMVIFWPPSRIRLIQ